RVQVAAPTDAPRAICEWSARLPDVVERKSGGPPTPWRRIRERSDDAMWQIIERDAQALVVVTAGNHACVAPQRERPQRRDAAWRLHVTRARVGVRSRNGDAVRKRLLDARRSLI